MDIITIISLGAISIQAMLFVIFVILNNIDKRQDSNKLSEPDNPLLLTIKAMENELAELHENNIHMERIQQLEKDIEEAHKHAEALSKIAGNYGSTMEEVGESIVGSVGGRDAAHTVIPVNSNGIVVGGILSKGLVVEKPEEKIESTCENESETNKKTREYEETRSFILEQHQEVHRKILEQLDVNIKSTIHEAFDDTKPDWEGYTNSLLNKDHNLISHTKGSIYQGDHKDIQGLLDYIEEELRLTGDTCLRFGSRTRFFSIMILLHNLSLDEFKSKVSYWDKSYDLLLANKESYGIGHKLFEQEVFNFEELRQAVVSYFKENEEEELLNLIVKASEEFHRTAYGQWNIIPRDGLSHEERAEKFIDRWVKNENN